MVEICIIMDKRCTNKMDDKLNIEGLKRKLSRPKNIKLETMQKYLHFASNKHNNSFTLKG